MLFCRIGIENPEWVGCSRSEKGISIKAPRHRKMHCSQKGLAERLRVSGGDKFPAAMTAIRAARSAAA